MKNLKTIVFFGTHELAVPALETLAEHELTPKLVVTRPEAGLAGPDDDPEPHPVREWAKEQGVDVVTSRRAAEPRLHERIEKLEPDLLVVADYGRPLPEELLKVSPRGAIELHPSLLPKLRGQHALRTALATGEKKTGVTVFRVDEEPWGGPILLQEELPIDPHEAWGELVPRAQELGRELLAKALQKADRSKKGPTSKKKQNHKIATFTQRMGPRHRRAPWSMDVDGVYNRLRAHSPPGLLAYYKYRPVEIVSGMPMQWVQAPFGESGTFLGMRQGKLAVLCGNSTVFGIVRLRRPGQEVQGASDFARAEALSVGDHFV